MGTILEGRVVKYAELIIRYKWVVFLLTLLAVAASATGMRNLEFSTNYRVFFSDVNPELTAFEDFQEIYTKNDNIMFVIQPGDGTVFAPEVADVVERITEKAWSIPYATRVDSISNFQHSWADGDDLTVEDLISGGAEMTRTELDEKKQIALDEPLIYGNILSPDADTTGINVTLTMPQASIKEVPEAVAAARAIAAEVQAEFPDMKIALSGITMLNNAFGEGGQKDVQTLIPIMYGVLLLFMFLSLRSVSSTIATLLVIAFSTMTAMGLAGYFGIKLTPVSVTAPTIILTLAIADSIHILVTMLGLMREGHSKTHALKESLRINFIAVTITSLTTIVGFLALNFSDSPPFWHLGNITAMGIAAAWVYSLAFLPAVLAILPIRVKEKEKEQGSLMQRGLDKLADFTIEKRRPILAVMVVAAVGLGTLVPTIELNDEFVKYFDHRVQFRNDAEFAIENLNGLYVVEYSVPGEDSGAISEPDYLESLAAFTAWLREQPEIRHVYSYTDVIKRLNKNLHGDDEAWYRIPEDRELAAQYLLLYELSLPYGLDLNDRINIDKSATRVTATLDNLSTNEIREVIARSENWLAMNTPDYMHTKATSASVMFSHISERNIDGMINGNIMAVILIAAIMVVTLRSISIGLMSLIPNSVPIIMAFGFWAVLVGQVGMAAAAVAATSLGIVVDDTVHFLTKYLRGRREKGLRRPEAIRYAFHTVGRAIVITTIILTFGFAVLATSTFQINAQMGLLTALAIVLALVVDFLLLPAILMIGYKEEKELSDEILVIENA